jgi:hypothetical protein
VTAPAAAAPAGLTARRALAHAAAALWLPVAVPLLLGMPADAGARADYLGSAPIVPCILAPVLLGLEAWFVVVGGAATLVAFAVLALALRELPRVLGAALQAVVAVAVAFEAIGFAYALSA